MAFSFNFIWLQERNTTKCHGYLYPFICFSPKYKQGHFSNAWV